ncbi:MAG: hypothetical protein D6791_07490 [Chloroflexi bacterium]|nr:MAG: hypothetical protein D6791_07490 [Chloroflexota bacterium]
MNKYLTTVILFLLLPILAACGRANAAQSSATETAVDHALSIEELALGSLKLEGTEQAIDQPQAQDLLPLWQAYQSLAASDTVAAEELQGLAAQIAEAMTSAQLEAIAAMHLDDEAVQAFIQEQGLRFGARLGAGAGAQGGRQSDRQGRAGSFPGGGPPGGLPGGGPPGGLPGGANPGQLSPEARATAIAERLGDDPEALQAFRQRALVGGVIRLLQSKTGQLPTPDPLSLTPFLTARLAEAADVDAHALQAGLDAGASLEDAITQNGGDLEAAAELLRSIFTNRYGLSGEALERQVTAFLQSGL